MKFAKNLTAAALCLSMTACATQEQTGQLIGGVVGALAGSAIAGDDDDLVKGIAIAAGAAAGAWIGGRIGRNLDQRERDRLAMSTQTVLNAPIPANSQLRQPVTQQTAAVRAEAPSDRWSTPSSNGGSTTGTTTLLQVNNNGSAGGECRTVRQLVVKNGQEVSEDVRFCRQTASSQWQPVAA